MAKVLEFKLKDDRKVEWVVAGWNEAVGSFAARHHESLTNELMS